MSGSKNEVLWHGPGRQLRAFDRGEVVFDEVPAHWDLAHGSRIKYDSGGVSGTAEVVSVDPEPVRVYDWDAVFSEGESPPEVPGVRCGFRRLN